ncbi:hypothetical protein HZA99_01875 [Candidatus Woesearchaeota archaeon]|nr:hypothetical protein [Candidatus Woesearchaeota archaeon]
MDIERLKKLNSLAGELKHQGIAHNHEDAAFLAVTMVGEEGEQCLSDMHINEDQSLVMREFIKDKPAKAEVLKPFVSVSSEQQIIAEQPTASAVSMNKDEIKAEMENVLQNFANALVQEFTALQQTVQQQNAQLIQLMEELHALPLQKQQQPTMVVQEQVPVQRTLQQPTQPVQSTPVAPAAGNPRTGTFATEDVSIEKMFYFGSKKS